MRSVKWLLDSYSWSQKLIELKFSEGPSIWQKGEQFCELPLLLAHLQCIQIFLSVCKSCTYAPQFIQHELPQFTAEPGARFTRASSHPCSRSGAHRHLCRQRDSQERKVEEDDRQKTSEHILGSTHVLLAGLTFCVFVSVLIWKFLSGCCRWRAWPRLVCVAVQEAGMSPSLSPGERWNKSRLSLVTQTLPLG